MKITVIPQIKNQDNTLNYKPNFKAKIIRHEDAFILPSVLGKDDYLLQSLNHRFFGKDSSLHNDITSWTNYFPEIKDKLRIKSQNGFFILSKTELKNLVEDVESAIAEAREKLKSSIEDDDPTSIGNLIQKLLENKGTNKNLEKLVEETKSYNNKTRLMEIVKQPNKEELFEELLNE